MAKGTSKAVGGSASGINQLTKGIHVEGSPGAYKKEAADVIRGAQDVLKDFGMEDELRAVHFNEKGNLFHRGESSAAANGLGDLTISTKSLSKGVVDSKGYNTTDSFYGTGAHEGGHLVVNGLLKRMEINPDETNKTDSHRRLEKAAARKGGKLENAVIKEASKRYGSNPPISGYGSTSKIEKVAEAVADVYANKSKANPYSKAIVGVLKDINNGTYKPKIKVSKREMGI